MKTLIFILSIFICANVFSQEQNTNKKLPEGVSQQWLNDLRDENGNIINQQSNDASRQTPEDPIPDAMQRKTFIGQNPGDYFGTSISNAGDVNGDGFDDIIVGAAGYSTYTGRAYIFFGGIIMNTIADVTMTGETTFNNFGSSVSSAGDVNGDGYSDVIVGATDISTSTGKAYIYFGGTAMNNVADVTMTGEDIYNCFGRSVSSADDVNGDGYSDVIVGADGYSLFTGRAYIFFGGTAMNNTADVIMTGEEASNSFGRSVSSAEDVNSDGYSDVIIGAWGYSGNTGRAYVYFGGATMDNVSDVTMTGEAYDLFGFSVSSAGDANGDGYSDIIVGAYGYSSNTGRAYVYSGGATMDNVSDVIMTGETGSYFGSSVSSAGDVNGDGYSDILIGAQEYSSGAGRAYVYFGGATLNSIADATMTGETVYGLGYSVSSAGDVNGDGYSDIIASAIGYPLTTGTVYLYDYYMKNEITHDFAITGEANGNGFSSSISSAGDVNGDGFTDIIVGATGVSASTGEILYLFWRTGFRQCR